MRLSPSTLFTLIITFLSIYMLPTLLRTTAPRFTASITAAAKSRTPTILTTTTRLTSPVLAGASLFNLGNSASFFGGSASGSKMGGNNEDAPLPPKVVMSDSEWQAKLSPEQVSTRFPILRAQVLRRSRDVVVDDCSSESSENKALNAPAPANTTSPRTKASTVRPPPTSFS